MKRFVLLSFLFLALGFYELSGGAGFDPQATRQSIIDARTAREADRRAAMSAPTLPPPAATPQAAQPRPVAAAGSVEPAAPKPLDLVSYDAAAKRTETAPAAPRTEPPAPPVQATVDEPGDETPALAPTPADTTLAGLGSVAFPGTTIRASSSDASAQSLADVRDIRTVKGERVNMRSGPGTDYDVVDQLAQSTRVEVLTDDGNGWVELRPVDGGPTGWIAAFLLSGG